jgi:hypothetical protein
VRFAKHDHVVETFAADRADESLNISILPGRSACDRVVPNAHCTDPLQEDWTIRRISIPNEISRRVVPRERFGDLARDPVPGWVCRHAKRQPASLSFLDVRLLWARISPGEGDSFTSSTQTGFSVHKPMKKIVGFERQEAGRRDVMPRGNLSLSARPVRSVPKTQHHFVRAFVNRRSELSGLHQ